MGGWALDARIYWQVKGIVFFLAGWRYPFDNNLLFFFFFFKTSHPSSIKTWAWAWPWPRGIHRWWDWTGPLLFGGWAGNITRTCMCIVCVLYETIPGKKHV